jgi:hypothetical protein
MMKKYSYIFTAVVLVLCFLISTSFLGSDDCTTEITIFNKLPSHIAVTIDGKTKRLPIWGRCKELVGEDEYKIIPCDQTWNIKWESQAPVSFIDSCSSDNDVDEDDFEEWKEEEPICKDYEVDVVFKGVKGLDRSLTLNSDERYQYVLSTDGFKRLKDELELYQPP